MTTDSTENFHVLLDGEWEMIFLDLVMITHMVARPRFICCRLIAGLSAHKGRQIGTHL